MGKHHIQILCIRIVHQWGHEKWIKITPNCQIWIIYTGYGGYGMEFTTVGISPADDGNRCVCLCGCIIFIYNANILPTKYQYFCHRERLGYESTGIGYNSACKTWTDWLPFVVINFVNHDSFVPVRGSPSWHQAAKVRPAPWMRGPWGSPWERWAQRAGPRWYPSCGPEGDNHPFVRWDDGMMGWWDGPMNSILFVELFHSRHSKHDSSSASKSPFWAGNLYMPWMWPILVHYTSLYIYFF